MRPLNHGPHGKKEQRTMNTTQHMLGNQLEHLAEVVARLRGLAEDADDPDGLATAKLVVALDAACRKLGRLGNDLEPGLFAEMPKRHRRSKAG
jgi:hypothetical protein